MATNTLLKVQFGFFLLLPILLTSSCDKPGDFEIKIPAPSLFISSNFKDKSAIEVEVSKVTLKFLEETDVESVTNAKVTVFEGENFLEELDLVMPVGPRALPKYTTKNLNPQNGKEYVIEVQVDGFKTVRARSVIPSRVEIRNFSIGAVSKSFNPLENNVVYNFPVYISYNDPSSETNYYHLKIAQQIYEFKVVEGDTIKYGSLLRSIGFGPDNDNNYVNAYFAGGVLLRDDPFGGEYTFNMETIIDPSHQKLGQLFVELRTVSEDYYRFHNSLDHQNQQVGGTGGFEESITPYYNVENGNGIFAGYTQVLDSTLVEIP